jgi:hypothetical protein
MRAPAKTKEKAPQQQNISAPVRPPRPLCPQAQAYLAIINDNKAALQQQLNAYNAIIQQQMVSVPSAPAAVPSPAPAVPAQTNAPALSPAQAVLAAVTAQHAQQPAQAQPAAAVQEAAAPQGDERTEFEWTLIKSISAALTPLITAYPTESLIPADPTKSSLEEQLEHMHTIAAFITKLKTKLETLSPESREFIKTASFAGNPIARMLSRNLLSLQSFFENQLASYKQIKPQSTLVKELKKLTTGCSKEVDALCQELLNT